MKNPYRTGCCCSFACFLVVSFSRSVFPWATKPTAENISEHRLKTTGGGRAFCWSHLLERSGGGPTRPIVWWATRSNVRY